MQNSSALKVITRAYRQRYSLIKIVICNYPGMMTTQLPDSMDGLPLDIGNGDGAITGVWHVPVAGDETGFFWGMLRASGLVNGDPADYDPQQNAYGGKVGIHYGGLGIDGHVTVFGQIEGSVVKILESRLDDGAGNTGRIRASDSDVAADIDVTVVSAINPLVDTDLYDVVFRF